MELLLTTTPPLKLRVGPPRGRHKQRLCRVIDPSLAAPAEGVRGGGHWVAPLANSSLRGPRAARRAAMSRDEPR
eukprot:scaffold17218_cov99-Phaeocystis_antarctica.AAC.2